MMTKKVMTLELSRENEFSDGYLYRSLELPAQESEPHKDEKKYKGGGIKTVPPSQRAKMKTPEVKPNEPT